MLDPLPVDGATRPLGDADGVHRELARVGFETARSTSVEDALGRLRVEGAPSMVLLGPGLGADATLEMIRAARNMEGFQPSLVVRGPADEERMRQVYDAGADDYVTVDAPIPELIGRIRGLLRSLDYLEELVRKERDAQAMLELTQALASSLDFREILYTLVRRIAEVVNVDRVSIVLAPDSEARDVGFVVATSDDEAIANLRLDLEKYPEIQQVLRTGEALTIDDAATHPVLDGVRTQIGANDLGALTLLPIVWREEALGVLFLRSVRRAPLSAREVDFCRILANATAIALRNARVLQSLRDQTEQVNFARFKAERQMRALTRYANLFTSAADGLVAVDPEGRVLFANPRTYELTGTDEPAMRGAAFHGFVHAEDRSTLQRTWPQVRSGERPAGVDLRIGPSGGPFRIVNCSFSSVAEGEGAVLVSLRDVSDERETARELATTKDFLEKLINASVDCIIASDLDGNVLLFNKGAERLYGYRAEEVVGRLHASDLYPEGCLAEVMRMLRSPQYGGVGRLETMRFEALDAEGRLVPINLSSAMIYHEDGTPFATVGICTDLREKLRFEERLARAQQKLAVTEKQALIAELAGTAAHELNQPLTSMIGYGELLQRRLNEGTSERHAADVIVQEAERMAEIVRKIGQITRYETKSYVGEQKILDLDKASGDAEGRG